IDLDIRDADVPLSDLGRQQAEALAVWFAALPENEQPDVVLASPYLRARQTAQTILDALPGGPGGLCADERLREREFGILDRLTTRGIGEHFPEQAAARTVLGKFYHRPPGGESWCDVILRLRSALDTLSLHHRGKRVLIVGHQVVVLCLRYLLEQLDEAQILAIDAEGDVANCGVTEYRLTPGAAELELVRYNFLAPLLTLATPVTSEPDAPVAVR
ncbi:MAG TPA: histidine phosphatase family protein, partial [Brevundimonas sp.]|nr:histidine phosphatase family protein [Brevundimonas sp.]